MMFSARCVIILTLIGPLAIPCIGAEDEARSKDAGGLAFFEAKIRPVLVEHCYACHAAESGTAEGSLVLDSQQGLLLGGDRGPAIVAGDTDASLLLQAISHSDPNLKMPPRQERLPEAVIADFRKWIAMGAPDPRTGGAPAPSRWADPKAAREFWAYRPLARTAPPDVDSDWPRQSLDAFVLSALNEKGLVPSPDAEPQTLLRRLHFDLVGLPPSPELHHRFLERVDSRGLESAIAAEVDELLASPAFGERWGRHWLDVARFAESSGGEANISFPHAWRYRDYVIDSFNADVPYDRFLIEQIAGDLLPYNDDADRERLLIATGYLAIGAKNLDAADKEQFHADLIDEQIDTVTRSVLASSVACARCHDHKFDPFSMKDYYALAGIFQSTKTFFGTAVSPANRIGGDPLVLPRIGQPIFHASIPAERVTELKEELAALHQEEADKRAAQYRAILEGKDASGIFTISDALRIFWRTGAIEGQLDKVDESGQALPLALGVLDREEPVNAPLLQNGDILRPGEPIPRGVPHVIGAAEPPSIPADQSGRLEVARWLVDRQNPLTSRVIVNRIWHHLLGAGLVRTVDNFGSTGDPPSHPELLDHLAAKFVSNGWSFKQMIREIVTSRTYRQASTFDADAFQRDPENRFLWRASKRRLEAEAMRDAMLAAAGELDLARPEGSLVARQIGDKPISLIGLDKRLPADLDGSTHRSVYLPVLRDRLPEVLDLFDFAEPSLVTGHRETTNVPVQSLYLMNSPFVQERSDAMADRLMRECSDDESRITRAFVLCFGRQPDSIELALAQQYLEHERQTASTASDELALAKFCHALFSTAEFRNLD